MSRLPSFDPPDMQIAFVVLIEAVIPTFVTFACLTVAWLCVAMGMRKIS
jgi:hypothetical protein